MKPMIVLTGPTAAGKTNLSIKLAKAVHGAVISADSMQVYKKMDIGTAKIMPEEMDGVDHYLVDILDPKEEFNVARFQTMAKEALEKIYAKGQIPIIVGGTGFYIQALLYDIQFSDTKKDDTYREELKLIAKQQGNRVLHQMLAKVDPKGAAAIHENNVKRVIRALEYYKETGEPISEHNEKERQRKSPYNFAYFVLTHERSILYDRINRRVDVMMERGLLKEVQQLKEEGYGRNLVSMQGLGYKEILQYLDGEISQEEAIYILKRDTRHFAKRQLTWFGRERDVIMIEKQKFADEDEILTYMLSIIRERGILC
ncbi:MAG: tRNA (adenosine(37)-N6)-dimethylallyltransferase MiaA [Lachnospiraceae bacterium]|nr:tRNA (adenosine(37)-N6)-dimethylallyltransferase MiaA [Lachnospiraceae bacterium]